MHKKILCILCVTGFFAFILPVAIVQNTGHGRIVSIGDVPARPVALVLGASVHSGKPSPILQDRLDVVKDLYKAGKVKKIIVSGDNRSVDYNEPTAMKNELVDQGIKDEDIITDFAGRRTYDSCYRLKEIFGQTSATVVTQAFHLPRALYLCRSFGIDVVGVRADMSDYHQLAWWYTREIAASWIAWWDVVVRHPAPVLGDKEKVFEE